MGRETKLDDLMERRICDALREGHSYAAAARRGGIGETTLHEWIARGRGTHPTRPEDARFARFAKRIEEADHAAEDRAVRIIISKFDSADDRVARDAAQWWLARRRKLEWAETKGEEPLTTEEAERLVAEAAQLIAANGKP